MLYKLNSSEVNYYYDLFEKHAYMNSILEFVDFDNKKNEKLISKCIYKKMYNPWKVVWKEYIKQLPISKEEKKAFLIEFDKFFNAIFKKNKIAFTKELLFRSVFLFIIIFFLSFLNDIINSFILWIPPSWVSEILLYDFSNMWINISLWTFILLLLLYIVLNFLVSKIEIKKG